MSRFAEKRTEIGSTVQPSCRDGLKHQSLSRFQTQSQIAGQKLRPASCFDCPFQVANLDEDFGFIQEALADLALISRLLITRPENADFLKSAKRVSAEIEKEGDVVSAGQCPDGPSPGLREFESVGIAALRFFKIVHQH